MAGFKQGIFQGAAVYTAGLVLPWCHQLTGSEAAVSTTSLKLPEDIKQLATAAAK